ncbi:hypothetical protein KCU99_g3535, partial [Aureobasidium melanogenum]
MATPVRNQSLELVDLPTEVLVEIFKHVPDEDLLSARLVCKKLCDAATPQFAKVYFTERTHVVSSYSIDALIKITEHPIFGDCVKTVAICGARRIDLPERPTRFENSIIDETDQNAYLVRHVNTGRFARRMERVFGNVRSRSGSVAIKIFDSPRRDSLDTSLLPTRCHGYTRLTKPPLITIDCQMVKTLELTVYAARRARCPIKYLKIALLGYLTLEVKLDEAMHKILESSRTPLSVCLEGEYWPRLSYNDESQCLELQRINSDLFPNSSCALPLEATYTWLLANKIKQLKITDTNRCVITRLRPFFTPRLTRLSLQLVSVFTENFDQNLWSEHIQMVSDLPGLEHCRLSRLRYKFSRALDLAFGQHIFLPSHGYYPCQRDTFYLTYRDASHSIEINGNDVCDKLKELACYVAAAEVQKVQAIVNAGRVNDFMVGIIDQVPD